MSPRPTVGIVTEELYRALEPLAFADEESDWPLLRYLKSIGEMLQEIDDYTRDTDLGPGWSVIVDVDRAPTNALGWLAQFAGVSLRAGLSDLEQREWIKSTDGFKRGTVAALRAAIQRYLTGTKYVIINERRGGFPYRLGIITLESETPDEAAVLSAIRAQKPAGIVLEYSTVTGQTWFTLRTGYDTFQDVLDAYDDLEAVRSDLPTP